MSVLNKIVGIWVVNKTVASTTPLLMRLLISLAAISMITIFTAFLGALITGAGIWAIYHELIANGMSTGNAIFVIALFALVLLFVLLTVIQHYWRKMAVMFKQIVYLQSPVGGRVSSLVDSFMSGFNAPRAS